MATHKALAVLLSALFAVVVLSLTLGALAGNISTAHAAPEVAGVFTLTANAPTEVTCILGDVNCKFSAVIHGTNRLSQPVYSATIWSSGNLYFFGFDSTWTNGQSTSPVTMNPGEGFTTWAEFYPPQSVGTYYTYFYADAKACNQQTTPWDCVFMGGSEISVTVHVVTTTAPVISIQHPTSEAPDQWFWYKAKITNPNPVVVSYTAQASLYMPAWGGAQQNYGVSQQVPVNISCAYWWCNFSWSGQLGAGQSMTFTDYINSGQKDRIGMTLQLSRVTIGTASGQVISDSNLTIAAPTAVTVEVNPEQVEATVMAGQKITATVEIENPDPTMMSWHQVDGQVFPLWFTPQPYSGTLMGFEKQNMTLYFDATKLQSGTYHTSVKIEVDDPGNTKITIPVTLKVLPELTKRLFLPIIVR